MLYYVLFHRMTDEFEAVSNEALDPARWEGASVLDSLQGLIEFWLHTSRAWPAFKAPALMLANDDPALRDHFLECQAKMYRGIYRLVLARRDQIGHPNPERAAAFALNQLGATFRARLDAAQKKHKSIPDLTKRLRRWHCGL